MSDPRNREPVNPRGTLGQPIIDPEKVKAFGSQLARATADLEAMRILSILPVFEMKWDGQAYTVTIGALTKTDPFLSRAILLTAQELGITPPAIPGKTQS